MQKRMLRVSRRRAPGASGQPPSTERLLHQASALRLLAGTWRPVPEPPSFRGYEKLIADRALDVLAAAVRWWCQP